MQFSFTFDRESWGDHITLTFVEQGELHADVGQPSGCAGLQSRSALLQTECIQLVVSDPRTNLTISRSVTQSNFGNRPTGNVSTAGGLCCTSTPPSTTRHAPVM